MIRRACVTTALLAALMLPSAAALAQDYEELPPTLERNVYLQVAGLAAFEMFDEGTSGQNSGGFSVRVGLRTSKWFAIEGQFEWVHGMEPDGNTSGDDWTTTFNARFYPFTDMIMNARVQPYLLIGTGVSSYKRNLPLGCTTGDAFCGDRRQFGFSSRWGGGVDVYITDEIAATADLTYVWAAGTPIKDLDYLSLGFGVLYRFY